MGAPETGAAEHAQTSARGTTWFYLTVVALTAGCGLVVEIVAGRMLAPYRESTGPACAGPYGRARG